MRRLGANYPAFLLPYPLLRVGPSEAPYGIAAAFPKITHQHAPLGAAGLHDLAVADIDTDVVDLLPSTTTWAAEVLPEHQVAGLKLAPAHHISVVVAPLGLSRRIGAGCA